MPFANSRIQNRFLKTVIFIIIGFCLNTGNSVLSQDIRTFLTVFDNVGNSANLVVGINSSATDGIDPALGEAIVPAPAPGIFDARLIDNDFRFPSLLGSGVRIDMRGIGASPPIIQTYEVSVQRDPTAASTFISWALPLSSGITSARIVSFPNQAILNVDMTAVSQVVLPPGTSKYLVTMIYSGAPLQRYALKTQVSPTGQGAITVIPAQADYAAGTNVTVIAQNLPAPDTCYRFSHWSGDASGTNPVISVVMNQPKTITANFIRKQYPVTISTLDTFTIDLTSPPPQTLRIINSGLACYAWNAAPTEPWISLSKTAGVGNDSITVGILTSKIPCQGTHAGMISITSDASIPTSTTVPVVVKIGRADLTAKVTGSPVILSCESKANDLIIVTITNTGVSEVTFPDAPVPGPGFLLKNPGAFPLTILGKDSARLYFEFAPLQTQRGIIVENVILTASSCGKQVLFKLSGTRVAPTVTADVFEIDFGKINSCVTDPLPIRNIVLTNSHTQTAQLRYKIPSGFILTTAPSTIPGGGTVTVSVQPLRSGVNVFDEILIIEADFGVCYETFAIALRGKRQNPAFRAEALTTPGLLPPQVFDTTCVGSYSKPKGVRILNTGTADLKFTLAIAPPFEIDAFTNVFDLPAGESKIVNIRFHPTTGGPFSQSLSISADQCNLSTNVSLFGYTYNQQVLSSTVTPATLTLANCEPTGKVKVAIVNAGSSPVLFNNLPDLPDGFSWDASINLPIIINPGPASSFQAYVTFQPPLGQGGQFGGSVQWFGEPCGTSVYFTLAGERILPQISLTPKIIDFGIINDCGAPSNDPGKTLTVTNNSSQPITVTAYAPVSRYTLYSDSQPFPTQGAQIPAMGSLIIRVVPLAGAGGPFSDSLTLNILAGTGGFCSETFHIKLVGERYKPSFIIREKDFPMDFGNVCVNTQATHSYILENTGDKQLSITTTGFPVQSPFQLLATPFRMQLYPGESKEFQVRYSPAQAGTHTVSLVFSNDACPQTITMNLRGRGAQPSFSISAISPTGPIEILTCEQPISKQILVSVRNTGPDPMTVVDGSILPEGFSYDPPGQFPFALDVGQTKDVSIRFSQSKPGGYGGIVILSGSPCEIRASFPLSVNVLKADYTVSTAELQFGAITICPAGNIRESDMDKLVRSFDIRNTGAVPMTVDLAVKTSASDIQILAPLTTPIVIPPGSIQSVKVGIVPPIDSATAGFYGSVELTVTREARCSPEILSIPFSGKIQRSKFFFTKDTISAISTCIVDPIEMQACLVNSGSAPVVLSLAIEGSSAFFLADSLKSLTLLPGSSKCIAVRYFPYQNQPSQAVLRAMESQCQFDVAVPLNIIVEKPVVSIACNIIPGTQPEFTSRPGDSFEIPVYLGENLQCIAQGLKLEFEIHFDTYALSPVKITSLQGAATYQRIAPDKIRVTITSARFSAGELARIRMEVLVGRTKTTFFQITNPSFVPSLADILLDESCAGKVTILPRNGVTTLSDLGISSLSSPRPNMITSGTSQSTSIDFSLARDGYVELKLYDGIGGEAGTVFKGVLQQGSHSIDYRVDDLRSGLYMIVLYDGNSISSQKLIIAR